MNWPIISASMLYVHASSHGPVSLTCFREAGAIILKIAYGYTVEPHSTDPLIKVVGDNMEAFSRAAVPGAFMVDVMPFCRLLSPP